jgi:hypothetical protein
MAGLRFGSPEDFCVNRLSKPLFFLVAAIYFAVDAVFMTVAKPLADWIANHRIFDALRAWIVSLRPYPTLALFLIPLIVLEPIKPAAAYMAATGHVRLALLMLAVAELLKLGLVERIFCIGRNKLMLIPAFGWSYLRYCEIRSWLQATEPWQTARRWSKLAQYTVRSYAMNLKTSGRFSAQAR